MTVFCSASAYYCDITVSLPLLVVPNLDPLPESQPVVMHHQSPCKTASLHFKYHLLCQKQVEAWASDSCWSHRSQLYL